MKRILRFSAIVAWQVVLGATWLQAGQEVGSAESSMVTVQPQETDEVLANPGMGWETFHRTCREDRSLPGWIPSTVEYARWGWGELEPRPGAIDYAFLDRELEKAHGAGQKLAFRVMCCSTTPREAYHPLWLRQVGGRELLCSFQKGPGLRIPDLDDPIVLDRHLDFIRRLGARYDGHADLDHVDLGSIGWWGEWHLSDSNCKLPLLANRLKVVDAYLAAFKKTPLVMLVGGGECLKYAVQHGAGWRADCLGDMGGFSSRWFHMRDAYPEEVREGGAEEAWKTAPMAWETCWDMRKWAADGWPIRTIFNYALAMHGSYLNNKSAPLPAGENVRPEIERFLKRLGYRLVLKQLSHPPLAKAGDELRLAMLWQNTGSAPCYRPYRLAYRLTATDGRETVIASTLAVNRWMPGSLGPVTPAYLSAPKDLPPGPVVSVEDTVRLPKELPAGDYRLAIGVVGEHPAKPVVRLGIQGRDESGWYPLSRIRID